MRCPTMEPRMPTGMSSEMVFSPIPFQSDALVATHEPPAITEAAEPSEIVPRTSLASTIAESFKQMLFPSCDLHLPS
ncbi:Os12g0129650 [Oryza sativa Japonica Group]|uniref:Os12g0129650 protein n=1 Tax=Oryza sativa subsp. japonica TaxID=39947 RepID=A0A0N7KTI7_ORYSJ|nr:hypothetical protein EE612_057563 [Oryza sativa]BAT15730.1 Os12g0129650 [Oryza sativa Japonica Group]